MCLGKVTIVCPNCKQPIESVRPDGMHPDCSFEKPEANSVDEPVIEQAYTCKNPACGAKLTLYWYNTIMFLDRA